MTEPILAFEHGLNRTQVAQLVFGRMSETGWLHLERALMTTKWFDYRFMPPFEATLCYICEYNIAYKHFRGSNFDHETSKHVKLVEPHYFYKMKTFEKHKKTLRSLWRGRQIADMAGMPYGVFLSIAFELRLRYWKRSFMPQANQATPSMKRSWSISAPSGGSARREYCISAGTRITGCIATAITGRRTTITNGCSSSLTSAKTACIC